MPIHLGFVRVIHSTPFILIPFQLSSSLSNGTVRLLPYIYSDYMMTKNIKCVSTSSRALKPHILHTTLDAKNFSALNFFFSRYFASLLWSAFPNALHHSLSINLLVLESFCIAYSVSHSHWLYSLGNQKARIAAYFVV